MNYMGSTHIKTKTKIEKIYMYVYVTNIINKKKKFENDEGKMWYKIELTTSN
jgi:hypothetical protein